jgi:hypothetical protein
MKTFLSRTFAPAAQAEAARLATLAVQAIGKRLETQALDTFRKAELYLTDHLRKIVEDDYDKFSKIKTLFSDGKLLPIDSIYVKQNLKWGRDTISEDDFIGRLAQERRFIITGSAGSGKSMLLRQTYRALASSKSTVYPIFVELRLLKSREFPSITEFVADKLSTRKKSISQEHVFLGLDEGALCLVLDGFDEIDFDVRERYQKEMLALSDKFNKAIIILSSRPDEPRFNTWQHFHEVSMLPMSQQQTLELINKIDEDTDVKERFLEQLRIRLFQTHGTFLSNPLLASMMLITFKRIADIPTKGHIFYKEAFAALYDRHDAQKGYARRRYTGLDSDTFSRAFAAFCFLSYAQSAFSMTEKDALHYIEDGLELEEIQASGQDLLKDLLESVCVLLRDGTEIVFAHRSFQEYFCALFIANNRLGDHYKIIEAVCMKGPGEGVTFLLKGINEEFLEREWVLPLMRKVRDCYDHAPANARLEHFLSAITPALIFNDKRSEMAISSAKPLGFGLFTTAMLYPEFFSETMHWFKGKRQRQKINADLVSIAKLKGKEFSTPNRGRGRNPEGLMDLSPDMASEEALRSSGYTILVEQEIAAVKRLIQELERKHSKKEASIADLLKRKRPR